MPTMVFRAKNGPDEPTMYCRSYNCMNPALLVTHIADEQPQVRVSEYGVSYRSTWGSALAVPLCADCVKQLKANIDAIERASKPTPTVTTPTTTPPAAPVVEFSEQ